METHIPSPLPKQRATRLGVASTIFSGLGTILLVGLIPLTFLADVLKPVPAWLVAAGNFYGPVAVLFLIMGVTLGFFGIFRKQRSRAFAWVGLLLGCAAFLFLAFIVAVVLAFAFAHPGPVD